MSPFPPLRKTAAVHIHGFKQTGLYVATHMTLRRGDAELALQTRQKGICMGIGLPLH
jgi:hypothetical protein